MVARPLLAGVLAAPRRAAAGRGAAPGSRGAAGAATAAGHTAGAVPREGTGEGAPRRCAGGGQGWAATGAKCHQTCSGQPRKGPNHSDRISSHLDSKLFLFNKRASSMESCSKATALGQMCMASVRIFNVQI